MGFKYLGIYITQGFSNLYKENFVPLIDKLKLDLKKWNLLFLSLAGRINCVKMNILPRFLYLFQCIPILLTKSFFQNLDRLISSFIWGGKTPRIRKEFLQRQKSQGGLALPNFRYYYWAANIWKVLYWLQNPKDAWCISEANSCTSSSLPALALSKLPHLYFYVYSMSSSRKYSQDLVSI